MTSSGILKKGLAAAAISALAVTGIPALSTSASADSITQQQVGANDTTLYTQYSTFGSVQNDGVNTSIHLLAGGGANVTQVRFEVTSGQPAATTTIATVGKTNGAFSTEWTPPVSLYGQIVTIRAVGLNSNGNPTGGTVDAEDITVGANTAAIDIANAPGSTLPIFQQPYGVEAKEVGRPGDGIDHSTAQGIVTGTTSGAGNITLRDLSDGSAPRPAFAPGDAVNGVRPFRGTVNFQNYTLATGANAVNEAIVGADQVNGSDDAEVVNLQAQTIGNVTAVASPAVIPADGVSTSTITITVVDNTAAARPVAGAQVIGDLNRNGLWDAATERSYYTDANGQVVIPNVPGSAAPGTSYDFFVNTDGGDDYNAAIDFRRTVTVTTEAQTPSRLTSASADGTAFDRDEYNAGDVTATLVDQAGRPVPNSPISYSVTFTPAVAVAGVTYTPQVGTATTNNQGVATIPVNLQNVDGSYVVQTYRDTDGTPGQTAGDLAAAPLTFKAGDSSLVFNDAPTANATAGTTATFSATLRLFDGTPLAGRLVDFTYAPTGNSELAAQASQPSGTTRNGGTARDTTDASGVVSVAVSDPAAGAQTAELNNTLTATTADDPANTADNNDDPDETGNLDVDFGIATAPTGTTNVTVLIDEDGVNGVADTYKPGVGSGTNTVLVTGDPDGTGNLPVAPIAGIAVTLTVDNQGFFTSGTNDPAAAAGNNTGELSSRGRTITVVTDANGVATIPAVSMERNEDFDDDGLAEAIVTATVGAASDTEDYDFDSSTPLNGGAVELVQVEGATDGPTRTDDSIGYDVVTTDQFGNRVDGETVALTENGSDTDLSDPSVVSDFDEDADVFLNADADDEGTLTATWNAPFSEFGAGPAFTPVTGNRNLTDTADFAFYAINFAQSTFTLDQQGAETVPVGTRVTEVLTALDQRGNPIQGLFVSFLRGGPSNEDSDGNDGGITDANGQAFYDFVGGSEGVANISAIVSDGQGGPRVTTVQDTVTFGAVRQDITAKLTGKNTGPRVDKLKVTTSPVGVADGARVNLFRINKNGTRVLVESSALNGNGVKRFQIADTNGKKFTRYVAKIKATSDSTGVKATNTRRIR